MADAPGTTIERMIAKAVIEEMRAQGLILGNSPVTRPRLLSIAQAADYLGRTAAGIRGLIASGTLKTVTLDRRVFLDIRDLDQAIDDAKGK